jgi:hypothetical protein
MESGEHLKLSIADYLADPAPEPSLSANLAHLLLTASPRHAWMQHPRLNGNYAPQESAKLDLGKASHAVVLEGNEEIIEIIHAENYKTKAAQAARIKARASGKIPLLEEEAMIVDAMANEATRFLGQSELKDVFTKNGGDSEVSYLWHGMGHCWLRTRPDRVSKDRTILVNFKTTGGSSEPTAWVRQALLPHGYDLQAAFGLHAIRSLYSKDATYVFVVQENEKPYACSLVGLSPEWIEHAQYRFGRALILWDKCVITQEWPGYPTRIAYADLPPWARMRDSERLFSDIRPGESVEL